MGPWSTLTSPQMVDVGRHVCSGNARSWHIWRRPPDAHCECFEVLHDCGEVELVTGSREASQPHALEAMMRLEELGNRTCLALWRRPIRFLRCDTVISAGIRFHHAGVNCKALALHQTRIHACPHNRLEHMAEGIAFPKAAVPIDRERRVIRHLVVEIEAAEPAIGKVKLNLLAQPALRPDAVAIADDQHPDHKLGVDRRTTDTRCRSAPASREGQPVSASPPD